MPIRLNVDYRCEFEPDPKSKRIICHRYNADTDELLDPEYTKYTKDGVWPMRSGLGYRSLESWDAARKVMGWEDRA